MGETLKFWIEFPESLPECSGEQVGERVIAELAALGTLGLEEVETGIVAYFANASAVDPVRTIERLVPGVRVHGPEIVPESDWGREWRLGLRARRCGRLWIRPSWCEPAGSPELCIDPEQAFGSGEHATTQLCLELLGDALETGDRVLDVGTGSGILALAALRLGAASAVGLDVERIACVQAAANGRRNGLAPRLYCGSLAALEASAVFDLVLANMLLGELRSCLGELAAHTGRALIVSGVLESELATLELELSRLGMKRLEVRERPQSGDVWIGGLWRPVAPRIQLRAR